MFMDTRTYLIYVVCSFVYVVCVYVCVDHVIQETIDNRSFVRKCPQVFICLLPAERQQPPPPPPLPPTLAKIQVSDTLHIYCVAQSGPTMIRGGDLGQPLARTLLKEHPVMSMSSWTWIGQQLP